MIFAPADFLLICAKHDALSHKHFLCAVSDFLFSTANCKYEIYGVALFF